MPPTNFVCLNCACEYYVDDLGAHPCPSCGRFTGHVSKPRATKPPHAAPAMIQDVSIVGFTSGTGIVANNSHIVGDNVTVEGCGTGVELDAESTFRVTRLQIS